MATVIRTTKSKPRSKPAMTLRSWRMGEGLPSITSMRAEIQDMLDVMMGRADPPVDLGVATLMEYADFAFERASELGMMIKALEVDGRISKGSHHYLFRTGELRLFSEIAKRASDLGSRRITMAQLLYESERTGRRHFMGMDGTYD